MMTALSIGLALLAAFGAFVALTQALFLWDRWRERRRR